MFGAVMQLLAAIMVNGSISLAAVVPVVRCAIVVLAGMLTLARVLAAVLARCWLRTFNAALVLRRLLPQDHVELVFVLLVVDQTNARLDAVLPVASVRRCVVLFRGAELTLAQVHNAQLNLRRVKEFKS